MKSSDKLESKKDNVDTVKIENQTLLERIKNLPKSSLEKKEISSIAYDAYKIDRFWGSGERRILLEGGLFFSKSQFEENLDSINIAQKQIIQETKYKK